MISIEKLSMFNIDKFRILYETLEDSYLCDKGFFDIYDKESFLVKFIIRKQVKLFKVNDKYVGYLWHECPDDSSKCCTIYGISFKDDFIEHITSNFLDHLSFKALKFDIIQNTKNKLIMNRLGFNIQFKSNIMHLDILKHSEMLEFKFPDNLKFKHFVKNQDEGLRCEVQNKIFGGKNRVPLAINDIYEEEEEEYFIEDFSVFLKNSDGDVLGYGQIILSRNKYTIVNFGILEQYRMRGYGEILLRYLINLCRLNSISQIFIRVEEANIKAINLYTKVGFVKCNSCVSWIKLFK
ncbi:MAG TPA: GNAT family N-acetyltransferase [Clostridium sp.]|nr:GNAT family N-acetyltransferase [Clostridium sp.]